MTKEHSLVHEIIASTGAGCASTILGHPLDTIKTHLQSSHHQVSTLKVARRLGINGLFRGIAPPLGNAIVMNTIMFSVFDHVKHWTNSLTNSESPSSSSFSSSMVAGIVSGFATACVSTPTDRIKILAQLSGPTTNNRNQSSTKQFNTKTNSWTIFTKLIQSRSGISTLYHGHMINLGREGVFTMIYLGLYDQLSPQTYWQIALTSSCTGALAWIGSYPLDTIKTIIQSQTNRDNKNNNQNWTVRHAIRHLIKIGNGGISAFYKGCATSTSRAVLVTSSRMIVYESVLAQF